MPVVNTKGAVSSQGFGEFAKSGAATYIEDVFSTWLYQGTSANQTITNGIDLSTKGGLVWCKGRPNAGYSHRLFDTARGVNNSIATDSTAAQAAQTNSVTAFNTTGFSLGTDANGEVNFSGSTYVGWAFRKQPKFFDVVTYTGTGANRTIAHNLGSTPGCIIVKRSDGTGNWQVYHNGLTSAAYGIQLNLINAQASDTTLWNSTAPTTSVFSVGTNVDVNTNGAAYVAYIFASNAGGFGLTGTDNVISCGSYTGAAVPNAVTLGYEPQWVMVKRTDTAGYDWVMLDVMRGDSLTGQAFLAANLSDAEATYTNYCYPTATGFAFAGTNAEVNAAGGTYIYIAIRRGPMRTPTTGTSVFSPIAYVGANGAAQNITAGFPVDMDIIKIRNDGTRDPLNHSRLMGGVFLKTDSTSAEASFSDNIVSFSKAQNVIGLPVTGGGTNEINGASTSTYIGWSFKRAPGFFDVVCYTGNASSPRTISHNLGVVPELIIIKKRSAVDTWLTYAAGLGNTKYVELQSTAAATTSSLAWNNTSPTSTVFTISTYSNDSGGTYVAYLFATCPNVSKVGSYTGTGATQTISCGFTGGARFVLVKRTDTTGDWYVWDTARGMVSGTDPSLLLNTTTAEVNANSIYTATGGFQIVSTAAGINASGGTYIFLAIA